MLTDFFKYCLGVFLLLFLTEANATHNRGGNITYKHLGGFTYEVTLMTCTYSEAPADRPELPDFAWGDGQIDTLYRDNSLTEFYIHPTDDTYDSQKNYYKAIHTYNGPGVYDMCIVDPNRNADIMNIANSVNVPFALSSTLIISPFLGNQNNSVQLDECPCPELACVKEIYCYNIAAFDPDGDSLSYALVAPYTSNSSSGCRQLAIGTEFVQMNAPGGGSNLSGAGGALSIDPVTGTMCWDEPQLQGIFNFTIEITEWRSGQEVGRVIRDIQLFVIENGCVNNDAPNIQDLPDTCVLAGDSLSIPIPFSDDFAATLTGYGEPFSANPAATVINPSPNGSVDTAFFIWNVGCSNVQNTPYPAYFIAQDGGTPVQLQDIETMFITVNAPPVTGLTVNAQGNGIQIDWDPHICSNVSGYKIYRKLGTSSYTEDCCSSNAPELMGYELVGSTGSHSDTSFYDVGPLVIGNDYCYIVTACFGFTTESCVSDQQCAQLKMDVPIITNVTVATTNGAFGVDQICWAMPKELDTLVQYGNHLFFYRLYRSITNSFTGANTSIFNTPSSSSLALTDTCYINSSLNTVSGPYAYRVDLYAIGESSPGVFDDTALVGGSNEASSVFLSITPNDNELALTWTEIVPWVNSTYEVYKETSPGFFTLLATTTVNNYTDTGLVNGSVYCYKIRSIGSYSAPGIINPILNWSQELCESPIDLTPPCPPTLAIDDDCENILNSLAWNNPNNSCADDVMSYNLYYAETDTSAFAIIATINSNSDTTYTHNNNNISIAGCYYVTAIDSAQYGNESIPSNVVCVDNCPYYWVPNIFTPNNDGLNDQFLPFPYRFIESVDAQIFNRWGNLIFQTQDPDIKWDGTGMESGEPVSDGTYYYVITVNTIRLQGIVPEILKGHLRVNRGAQYSGN